MKIDDKILIGFLVTVSYVCYCTLVIEAKLNKIISMLQAKEPTKLPDISHPPDRSAQ